ncbi:MAG TPA: hypothetical protein PLV45_14300, partial [bacterium]|nr:hypothetical protein [bacterium]
MKTDKDSRIMHLERDASKPRNYALHGAFNTLIPKIQKAIAGEGYKIPTPVQEQSIPELLEGRDLIGTAQT